MTTAKQLQLSSEFSVPPPPPLSLSHSLSPSFSLSLFRLSNLGKTVPIFLGGKQIKRVKHTKYLGVHLDENLKWEEHIDNICSKINRSINGLRQARDRSIWMY